MTWLFWLRSQSTQIIIPVSGNLWVNSLNHLLNSKIFINLDLRIELHIKSPNYNEKIYEDAKQFKSNAFENMILENQFICDPDGVGVCSRGRLENLCLCSRGTETLM